MSTSVLDEAAVRAELQKLPTVTALKQRARESGVTADQLDDAYDAPEGVRAAVIDLIVAQGRVLPEAVSTSLYGQ